MAADTEEINKLAAALRADTASTEAARARPEAGGIPAVRGLYAWWVQPGAIPGVVGARHPKEDRELLYVGIAPSRDTSSTTIRSRVLGQHLRGNIGASTFRLSLAALLIKRECWSAYWKHDRPLLVPADNKKLSAWQVQHLRLTWAEHPHPRAVEDDVIRVLHPPLNLAGNADEPFYETLADARARLRSNATGGVVTCTGSADRLPR